MTDISPVTAKLAISDNVRTHSVNRGGDDLCVQQTTPSGPIQPPTCTTEQPRAEEVVFVAVDEQQKQVQLSEVRIDGVDEDSEKLAVNVVKSSAKEKTTTIIGGYMTEEGELCYSAWVVRHFEILEEQLSLEINKYCVVSADGSVAEDLDTPQYKASHTEKFCDCLCQAYTCSNLSGLAKRGRSSPAVSKVENFATENLRKARAHGRKTIAATWKNPYTETFLGALFQDISVYVGFLLTLGFLITVIVGFINDQASNDDPEDDTFRLAKLVIGSVELLFFAVDMVHHACVQRCKTCKQGSKCVPQARERFNKYDPHAEDSTKTTEDDAKSDAKTDAKSEEQRKDFLTVFDAFRTILLEMMNYPNLLLSIFQLLVQVVYKDGNAEPTTYISLIFSLLKAVFFVYIARWFVLVGSIYSIQKIRTGDERITAKSLFRTSSAWFHIAFVSNAIGHMVVQMLMIVAIASRFHHEIQNTDSMSTYRPSGQLWYMMVFAYVGPFLGLIMFLITCHFWTQQFPIELFLDMLKLLKKPGKLEAFRPDKKAKDYASTMRKLHFYLDEAALQEEFVRVKKEPLEKKLVYPFVSPFRVMFCVSYCALILAFWFCAGINGLDSTEWKLFYAIGALFAIFVNGYVCAVAIFWITVLVLVLCLIALIIALFIFAVGCSGSSDSSRSRRNPY